MTFCNSVPLASDNPCQKVISTGAVAASIACVLHFGSESSSVGTVVGGGTVVVGAVVVGRPVVVGSRVTPGASVTPGANVFGGATVGTVVVAPAGGGA